MIPRLFERRLLLSGKFFAWGSAVIVATMCSRASAQWGPETRTAVADQIERSAESLDEGRFPILAQAAPELLDTIERATDFLRRKTDATNFDQWMEYLDFGPLVDALNDDDASPAVAGREAVALRYRLIGITPGLELTVLRNVRTATETLIASIRFRNPPRVIKAIAKEMKSVAALVREEDNQLDPDTLAELTSLVGLLEDANQAAGLTASIRSRFAQPNLVLVVHESIIQTAVAQSVNQCSPVDDCILGTKIVGNASLNGSITADVQPSIGSAKLQVSLAGDFYSTNRGYNGPVQLRTTGQGNVLATRAIYASESGVRLEPTYARVVLGTDIVSIQAKNRFGRRIIERVATKRANETKPSADRIAADRLRAQVGDQFDEQTGQAAKFDPSQAMNRLRPWLRRMDLPEPARTLQSTETDVLLDLTVQREDQLAAAVPRPILSSSYEFAIQVHESMIDNLVTPVLAGRTLNETELQALVAKSGFDLADRRGNDTNPVENEEESADSNGSPFEIDFARQRPVVFEADRGTIRVGIRGTRFAQGERELKRSLEITAVYVPGRLDDGTMILIRQGETKISFPGSKKRLSIAQAGLRRTIEEKFQGVFPETLLSRPIKVPADSKLESIAGREFRPTLVEADGRWLSIGMR